MKYRYPYGQHLVCLLPLTIALGILWFCLGSEAAVFVFFTEYRGTHPLLTQYVQFFTTWGNPAFYLVYGLFFFQGMRREKPEHIRFVLAYFLAQLFIAAILGRILKVIVGRPRPMTGGDFIPFSLDSAHHSLPSGHTTEITGACLPLAQRYKSFLLSFFLGLVIAAMGLSRIYLSMHHPTDILAGLLLGSLSGYCAWYFCQLPLYWWRRGKHTNKTPWRGI